MDPQRVPQWASQAMSATCEHRAGTRTPGPPSAPCRAAPACGRWQAAQDAGTRSERGPGLTPHSCYPSDRGDAYLWPPCSEQAMLPPQHQEEANTYYTHAQGSLRAGPKFTASVSTWLGSLWGAGPGSQCPRGHSVWSSGQGGSCSPGGDFWPDESGSVSSCIRAPPGAPSWVAGPQ